MLQYLSKKKIINWSQAEGGDDMTTDCLVS